MVSFAAHRDPPGKPLASAMGRNGRHSDVPLVLDIALDNLQRGPASDCHEIRVGPFVVYGSTSHGLALNDLAVLPVRRAPHRPLLARCWELRANLTPDNAACAALAEALEATLLTGDQRLARAPGPRCPIEIFQPVQ